MLKTKEIPQQTMKSLVDEGPARVVVSDLPYYRPKKKK